MQHNPYSPPRAELRDAAPDQSVEKPGQVKQAVLLLWGSIALGLIIVFLDFESSVFASATLTTWMVIIVVFAIMAIIIAFISAGHNWARILFLILFAAGAVPYFFSLVETFEKSILEGVLSVLQTVAQALAMYLVFTRPGSAWFLENK